ncbi:kinase-like domain-containing protein [Mycena olivaceomarginata]|nr:kinase-like domain-containing protein [Mycena olivaceomarginata]
MCLRAALLAQGLSSADLRDALQSCEQLICASLRAVLGSRHSKAAVLLLEADRAQSFLDTVKDARRLVVQLLAESDQLPSSLFITGVTDCDEQGTFGGGFRDVYRASYGDKTVALKRIRIFQENTNSESKRIRLVNPLPRHSPEISQPARARGRRQAATPGSGGPRLPAFAEPSSRRRGVNILVSDDLNACLADFGLTSIIAASTTDTSSTNHAGSTRWLAPELLQPSGFGCDRFSRTPASDVYAFACLHTGRRPFSDVALEGPVILKVIAGERPARPDTSMSDDLWALVTAAWVQNFRDRPDIETIIGSMRTKAGLTNHG